MSEIDAVLGASFPFPVMLSGDEIINEFAKLKAIQCRVENDEIRPRSRAGLSICRPFFPNRYRARSHSKRSAFEAWHRPGNLKRAIVFQRDCGDPTTPARVLRALTLLQRTPSIFRPAVAKLICERYARDGTVWDPCAGYGGRLLGAAAAGTNYIGTDIEPETVEGNCRLAVAINANAVVCCESATVFTPPAVDLVFTSPPYFDREVYGAAHVHHASVDVWFTAFIQPIFARAHKALIKNGVLAINIADIRIRGVVVPLVQKTIDSAVVTGFKHTETLRMPLPAVNRVDPFEPILIFRKL